jgi:hypothetical protein
MQDSKLIADALRCFRGFLASRLNVFADTRHCVASTKDCRGDHEYRQK